MKWLALLLVAVLGVAAYLAHVQSLKEAQEKAELIAYNQTNSQIERERAARELRPQMAVAKALEPLCLQMQAPLNLQEPADLLPIVQATKQHILDQRVDAAPARALVFDRAAALLNYLAAVADERTKTLKSMIRNRGASSGLSRSDAGSFFNQSVAKRWEETLARARPGINQLLEQVRAAEREWNKEARQGGSPEDYELGGLTPVMIPVDAQPEASSLSSSPGSRPDVSRSPRGMGAPSQGRTPGQ
jgi:hypothetical protein